MTNMQVKGWGDFQHYKDRSPAWIKLHRSILDNYEFQRLPVASKALAPCIWLLAAETNDGSVCVDPSFLAFRLRMTEQEATDALKPLIEAGFLVAASKPIAKRKQETSLEREKRERREREEKERLALLADWLPEEAWKDWHDFRNARKGWTPKARELSLATLAKLHAAGHQPRAVIEQSIERGWTGLFPLKATDQAAPSRRLKELA
jgi:DNA-binding MarR family transcriptional regulator